ncbi:MAG: hypothetical protein HY898_23735 [Deltaproteobacteria bacterium]|nr:hypothetical protein [Deltaproteobacteria bacterium]
MRVGTTFLSGSCIALFVLAGGCSSDSEEGTPINGADASSDGDPDGAGGTAGKGGSAGAKDGGGDAIGEAGNDAPCPANQKLCGGTCVSVDDPAYGCDAKACQPACAPAHATAKCQSTVCTIDICEAGWSDCDGFVTNGCEADVATDVNNCSGCGKACAVPDGSVATCTNGVCSFCPIGKADCDGNSANGCEVDIQSDVNNCGECGTKCTAGGACTNGACDPVELASGLSSPMGIRVDDTSIFVTAGINLSKIPIAGGTPTHLATGLAGPGPMALDDTTVYFSAGDEILSVPKAGGAVSKVASGVTATVALAVDDTNVFVCNFQGAGGGIWKVAKTGGTATLISPQNFAYGLAIDATDVFFALSSDDKIMKMPKAGGAASELATAITGTPKGVALDADTVFWFEVTDVVKVGKDGTGKKSIAQNVVGTNSIAVDGSWVYFAVFTNPGSIQKARTDGAKVVKLADNQNAPIDLALGKSAVFYLTQGDGKVMTVPK